MSYGLISGWDEAWCFFHPGLANDLTSERCCCEEDLYGEARANLPLPFAGDVKLKDLRATVLNCA